MKSAKTKIAFGVLDLAAAVFAVWFHITLSHVVDGWMAQLLLFPFSFSFMIVVYDLRSLMQHRFRMWEFGICSAFALAGIVLPNISNVGWFYEAWGTSRQLDKWWVAILGINCGAATALVAYIYAWYWGIPRHFLCPVALRCSVMPVSGGLITIVLASLPNVTVLGIVLYLGIPLIYLAETALYLRTGWKERTPREEI